MYNQMLSQIRLNYSQLLHELDELRTKLQHKRRYFVHLVPTAHYKHIKLGGKPQCVTLCLLHDNLVKLSLAVTRNAIYITKGNRSIFLFIYFFVI